MVEYVNSSDYDSDLGSILFNHGAVDFNIRGWSAKGTNCYSNCSDRCGRYVHWSQTSLDADDNVEIYLLDFINTLEPNPPVVCYGYTIHMDIPYTVSLKLKIIVT